MVAKATVRIEGEDATAAAWRSTISRAQASANQIQRVFKSALAFAGVSAAGAAFTAAAKRAIEFGDSINKASIKAGIGGKAMSELAYAANLADVDIASLSTALKKMQVSLSEAGTGAKGPTTALAALGLTIKQLQSLRPEDQFELLGDRISKLQDPADRARAATELFGKAGADLLPLFEQGAEGIQKARIEAEKLGLSFNDAALQKFAAADDAIKRLSSAWEGFAATLTLKVAPALTWTMNRLAGVPLDINEQIANLEDDLANATGNRGMSVENVRASIQAKIDALRKLSVETSKREMGVAGSGPLAANPPGFAGAQAADEVAKAREKKNAETIKRVMEANERAIDIEVDYAKQKSDEQYDYVLKHAEELEEARRRIAAKTLENAQIFKDAFLNAWDDMVNNGKFKIDELFKYIIAEFARRGIAKLFDSIFAGGGSGGGIGGWIDKGIKAIGGIFGGARANGGDVQAGKSYLVGERGMEMFTPGASGSITPNDAMGGSISIDARTSIDARGASMELMKVLPKLLENNRKATIAEVIDGLRRNRFAT